MARQKEFIGTVTSDKMKKTIIVRVMRMSKHPKYSRIMKRYNKFKAHDEKGEAKLGDTVRIRETRPLSKEKRFRLIAVLKKAEAANIELKDNIEVKDKVKAKEPTA